MNNLPSKIQKLRMPSAFLTNIQNYVEAVSREPKINEHTSESGEGFITPPSEITAPALSGEITTPMLGDSFSSMVETSRFGGCEHSIVSTSEEGKLIYTLEEGKPLSTLEEDRSMSTLEGGKSIFERIKFALEEKNTAIKESKTATEESKTATEESKTATEETETTDSESGKILMRLVPRSPIGEHEEGVQTFDVILHRPIFPKVPKNIASLRHKQLWLEFEKCMQWVETKTKLFVQTKSFSEGVQSLAFHASTQTGLDVVIKVPKKPTDPSQVKRDIETRKRDTSIACYISACYRDVCLKKNVRTRPIFYVPPLIFEIQGGMFRDQAMLYGESHIDKSKDNLWKKYSNNGSLCIDETMGSFSHFSLWLTEETLVITDLQGIQNVLTDPAIHSRNDESIFMSSTNLGVNGIINFLGGQHPCCNDLICQKLEIKHPTNTEIKPLNFASTADTDQILAICSLCYCHLETTFGEYVASLHKGYKLFCPECEQRRKAEMRTAKCGRGKSGSGCGKVFHYSKYFYDSIGFPCPVFCPKCIGLQKQKHRKDARSLIQTSKATYADMDATWRELKVAKEERDALFNRIKEEGGKYCKPTQDQRFILAQQRVSTLKDKLQNLKTYKDQLREIVNDFGRSVLNPMGKFVKKDSTN